MTTLLDLLRLTGTSYQDVADGTGLGRKTIFRAAHGQHKTRQATKKLIASFFGMTPDQILFASDYAERHMLKDIKDKQ